MNFDDVPGAADPFWTDLATSEAQLREVWPFLTQLTVQSPRASLFSIHPNLPPDLWLKCLDNGIEAAPYNPSLHLWLLEDPGFLHQVSYSGLNAMLQNQNLPGFLLHLLCTVPRMTGEMQYRLCLHVNTPNSLRRDLLAAGKVVAPRNVFNNISDLQILVDCSLNVLNVEEAYAWFPSHPLLPASMKSFFHRLGRAGADVELAEVEEVFGHYGLTVGNALWLRRILSSAAGASGALLTQADEASRDDVTELFRFRYHAVRMRLPRGLTETYYSWGLTLSPMFGNFRRHLVANLGLPPEHHIRLALKYPVLQVPNLTPRRCCEPEQEDLDVFLQGKFAVDEKLWPTIAKDIAKAPYWVRLALSHNVAFPKHLLPPPTRQPSLF